MEFKVACCQFDMAWESVADNLRRAEVFVALTEADLVVLPEMFATGFGADPERAAQTAEGSVVEWMRKMSQRYGHVLAGSVIVRTERGFANRLLFVRPDGSVEWYDKRHLFSLGGEDERFVAGDSRRVVEWRGMRFLLTVCYDLRFPVWCRNRGDYDAILCVASWPAARREVWRTLLRARAIENQAYVIGVNRTGSDPQCRYAGDSAIIDFRGDTLCEADDAEGIFAASLDRRALDRFRAKFPVWRDADDFRLL
ncbi:amidohydrolase [uncultured Alistipes sp.]|uniref:amidohydrolase n=1 Tax=uncultured Alistipes sp. TaxID=538949 RepID=UPI00262BAD8C|nr:amidohydrolase [uncultured Alistipes sp.]